jgi:hypothetical protein
MYDAWCYIIAASCKISLVVLTICLPNKILYKTYAWLYRDLDMASMEAVAALLSGLPLQPEESDRGDIMEAKSQLFLK